MYILVSCVEREIELVGKYQLHSQAYEAMERELAGDLELDGVPDYWEDVEEFEYGIDFSINYDEAWSNNGGGCDWKIIHIRGGNKT